MVCALEATVNRNDRAAIERATELQNAIAAEGKKRAAELDDVHAFVKKTATDAIVLEWLGVFLLAVGLLLTTASAEIAGLFDPHAASGADGRIHR
jgi:hypothetical protein